MAFSGFGNPGGAMGGGVLGGGVANIQNGPDLEDIQTEALGFLALAGESKVQLLPSPWPVDNMPPPTASLMSVASQKGLIAAAGPDVIILASTDSVRKAFDGPGSGDGNFKPFQPQMKIPMPMRISQLAFSADESYLVLAAEVGGGLAVYEVQALLNGSSEMAFQLSTNGQRLRALVPNPTPDKGELFAIVTADGNLMMANLKQRAFVSGPNGQILKDGVSCLSWSAKGKQLVAGLGNGTAYQMTPEGVPKGDIPKPPGMDNNHHISSITWLENNVFLMIYTPSAFDAGMAPSAVFSIVTRQQPSSFQFQKISEPVGPYGLNRSPPHHFLLRLRDFPPHLQDLLIVASTASTDIGLFSRSETPLAINKPMGVFTMTELSDDSRRAQLPMTGELNDTSPIGFALDLSSRERVVKPIPSDEMDESQTPLPALMVLNNDGVLASWWIVYSESVRQGTIYPNLVSAGGASQPPPASVQTSGSFNPLARPSFAAPANTTPTPGFGTTSGIGQRQSAWGTPSNTGAALNNSADSGKQVFGSSPAPSTTFNTPSNVTGFGKLAFGSSIPTSNSKPSFGAPSLGATSTPSFGNSGFSSQKSSPWGTAAASNTSFGQPTGLGKTNTPFGSAAPSTGNTAPSSGGFASFASGGGFAAAAPTQTTSVFGAKPAHNIFGASNLSSETKTTPFGITGDKLGQGSSSLLGASSNNFILGSTFKADGSAKDDGPAKLNMDKTSMFGSGFGTALGDAGNAPARPETITSKDNDMDSTDDAVKTEEGVKPPSTTPASTPAPSRSPFPLSSMSGAGNLFRSTSPALTSYTVKPATPGFEFGAAGLPGPKPATFSFANLKAASPENPSLHAQGPAGLEFPSSPAVKEEPPSKIEHGSVAKGIPDAPIPPDPMSKTSYTAGDTSVSSTGTDAPLPPDFITKVPSKPMQLPNNNSSNGTPSDLIPPRNVPGGPDDETDDSDFLSEEEGGQRPEGSEGDDIETEDEGSGEDVTKDISPTSEMNETPGLTPQNSFGDSRVRGTDNTIFTKIEKPTQSAQPRSLFGEINLSAPILPPNLQSSPRSPSPIRSAIPRRMLRPEASRSVSAPGIASQILGSQPPLSKSTFALSLEQQQLDERRKAEFKARKEAEESQALVDNRDDELHAFIASDLELTRTLDEFLAHVESNGPPSMDSIPAQVETVYRDINSMIDTLGLNARALKCFIKGHTEQYKDGGRTKEDLEDEDEWCLVELEDLSVVIGKDLTKELESGRVKEVPRKLEICSNLQKDLLRLHARREDVKKILGSHSDSHQLAIARAQPLGAEQAAQQHDLRRDFTNFQNLLSEAEEGLTILKAKVVSQAASNVKPGSSAGPTVEAVMRTITKMTSMAEKRSGDVDVLEGQMRKLKFASTASVGSREGSPFAAPNNRASLRNPGTSSTYGLFYTPDSVKDDGRGFRNSLMSSTSSFTRGSPPRKKMSGFSADEKLQLKSKLARKKEVTDRLKLTLRKNGTKVRLMDQDE